MDSRTVAEHWEANAETWTSHVRAGYDVYRDLLNTPAFLEILPAVNGLEGLDIGCGEGANTRQLARLGARMHAIDVAPTFIRHAGEAEAAEPLGIDYAVADALALPFPEARFDFATAFMSLMDMPDPALAIAETFRVLRAGGFLQFSILHPCFVPPYRKSLRDADGRFRAAEVGRYFDTMDGAIDVWSFGAAPAEVRSAAQPFRIPRFHRTLSAWIDMSLGAGFTLEKLAEPRASEAVAAAEPNVADNRDIPIFLHVGLRKTGA